MKKLLLIFFPSLCLNFIFLISFSQNLVPNCSFEDTVDCPDGGMGIISYSTGWYSCGDPVSSPDYFSSCGTFPMVPNNQLGFQYASSGNTYTGIAIYVKNASNNKEFIARQLSNPLAIGQLYFISLKVSFTLNPYELGYAANKMGVLFSTIQYNTSSPAPVNNFAHIYTNTIITDSINWTTISGWFTADSSYQYINIGNFFDDANTDTITYNDSLWAAYYYIDDICVSVDSTKCNCLLNTTIQNKIPKTDVQIFIDAYNAYVLIYNDEITDFALLLYDMFGREVRRMENLNEKKLLIDNKGLINGIYIVKIYYSNKIFAQKIIITN